MGQPSSNIILTSIPDAGGKYTSNYTEGDSSPSAIVLTPANVVNATASAPYTATTTVAGVTVAVPISVTGSGMRYKIGAGAFTTTPGVVNNAEVVTVELVAGAASDQLVGGTLNIGGQLAIFTVRTTDALAPELIGRMTFSGFDVPTSEGEGLFGFGVVSGTGCSLTVMEDSNGKFLRGHYGAGQEGSNSIYGGMNLASGGDREVYIQFRARMPNIKYGLKNIKLFGIRNDVDTSNYANATFSFDYTGIDNGCFNSVQWGDGTTPENDSNNVLFFDGTYPAYVGRGYGTAVLSTPKNSRWESTKWGTSVHLFQFMFRHNTGTTSGNEIANGALEIRIDGELYAKAENIFTRHPSNAYFGGVGMFGITQNNVGFGFDYDIYEGLTVSRRGWIA